MSIIRSWNEADWKTRILFLEAICSKDPAMVERILKRCDRKRKLFNEAEHRRNNMSSLRVE